MHILKKIQKLESKRRGIEQELFLLKQQNVQKLSSALALMEDVHHTDINTIIGSVLKSIEDKNQDKEALQSAGKSFCKQFKSQMDVLLSSPPTEKLSLEKDNRSL